MNPPTTRDPSSGGSGMRLSVPRITLSTNSMYRSWATKMLDVYVAQISPMETSARAKLVSGPAAPTQAMPRCPSLKKRGSTGTGFAQPKKKLPARAQEGDREDDRAPQCRGA